jgi:two-component system, NtrC family, sensor histidine kinase GlrK
MKVSTRIIAGYVILILLTVAIFSYQVYMILQLNEINIQLSQVNVENALKSLQLQYDQRLIEESALKYYGTGDPIYKNLFDQNGSDFETHLMNLQPTVTSEAELEAIRKVSRSWKAVQDFIGAERKPVIDEDLTKELTEKLVTLRSDTAPLSEATNAAILSAADRSARTAARAVRVSWIAASSALALSILVSVPIVWSITSRLRELGKATRAVAAGQFEHRMTAFGTDEFSDLAGDFNTMAQRLGELDQMKKDFVSHVSHDLKGPLASTRETVHILLEGIPGPLNDKQRRLLTLCLKSSERLSGMIGNLLDVSRMEAGMMDYKIESCDLVPLARNAASELEGLAREKKLELIVESAVPVIRVDCDQGRITQVISNLIENAIKFSPASSQALVRIEANGEYAILSVWDRGPGVPMMSRSRIFDRFHQVNPGKKIAGQSVGLGLAICRTIIEAHGGSIWVADNPGGGSVFYMKIKSSDRART